jgi:hypothetical protein
MFLLLSLLLFCENVQSQEFLTISPLLKKHKLELVPVEQKSARQFLLFARSKAEGEKILLAADGEMLELKKVSEKMTPLKSEACESEIFSYPYESQEEAKADFALIGKKIPKELRLKWLPLKEISFEKPENPKMKKGYILSQFKTAESQEKDIYYFLESDSKQKQRFASLEKKWGEAVYEKFSPDCSNREYSIQSIGKISNQGKNTTYLTHPVDCNGLGYKRGTFDRPIGILEISELQLKEKWVIYRVNGYEGDGFLAIQLEPQKGKTRKIDYYIYSGC